MDSVNDRRSNWPKGGVVWSGVYRFPVAIVRELLPMEMVHSGTFSYQIFMWKDHKH